MSGTPVRLARSSQLLGLALPVALMVSSLALAQEQAETSPPPAPVPPPPAAEATPQPPPEAGVGTAAPAAPALPAEEPVLNPEGYYDPGEIEEIKVTVDRRAKRLQDYPGSANAFTQEDLDRLGVQSVNTISNIVPGVQVGNQEGNTEIFIRGVGSDNNTELGDPAAATHIDGIYIPRPRGLGSMFFDVERVEVNRGPQGTLRGRNATAGSLNIITAKPRLGLFEAQTEAQLGSYSQRLLRAMINVPVLEALAFRLAAASENRDPFFANGGPVRELRGTEDADDLAYRLQGRWQPHQRVSLVLGHDYLQQKGSGYGGSNFATVFAANLDPNDIDDPRRVFYRGSQASQDATHWGLNAILGVDLGPVQLEYLGGYRDLLYEQNTGGNAGVAFENPNPMAPQPNPDNFSTSFWRTASRSTVQELRLYAPDSARLRWTVGGFYFREDQDVFLGTVADQSTRFAGVEFNMPDVKGQSLAGYADATFDITKRWRVTGGIRYTTEEKSRTGLGAVWQFSLPGAHRIGTEGFRYLAERRTNYNASGMPFQVFLDGIERFGARDSIDEMITSPAAADMSNITAQQGESEFDFIDWRGAVEFDIRDDNLLYLTAATGHKSGGFNDNFKLSDGRSIAATYKPESVLSFELGSKNEFYDRKLRLNGAAFYYLYRDQVFQTIVPLIDLVDMPPGMGMGMDVDPSVAASAVRYNAARSGVLGLELEGFYYLPWGLQAGAQALLLDAKFQAGSEARDFRLGWGPADSPLVDLEGNWLPRTSRLTVNYMLGQFIRSPAGWFDWIVSAQTRTKHYMTIFNGEGFTSAGEPRPILSDVVPTYTRVDLGVGWLHPNGKVRLEGFVTNLTDVAYMTTLINTPGLNLRFFNPPRQVGLRARVYF